jgi:hypothetical protein
VLPYWSRAVIVTLKGVPAVGVNVVGTTVKEESAEAGTVTDPLAELVAVHDRNTAVTVYV